MHHTESGIEVFVLAAPGRDLATATTRDSLNKSDIGPDFTWCEHPAGIDTLEHWSATFDKLAASEAPMVLLLEDDCIVNKHILANVRSWSWPDHEDFGAGWLYNPGGYCGGHDVWYVGREWYGTVAVLYWTVDVPKIKQLALNWMRERKTRNGWDMAVSFAVHALDLKIRVHGPPLVEHQLGPSLLDHQHSWEFGTTRGTFLPDWRRVGHVPDAHTRKLTLRGPDDKPPRRKPRQARNLADVLTPIPVVEEPEEAPAGPRVRGTIKSPPHPHRLDPVLYGRRDPGKAR